MAAPSKVAEKVKSLSSQASEERYQAFIRNSHEGIWRFEVDRPIPVDLPAAEQIKFMYRHAYLAEANEAMAEMYGLSSVKDIIGARLGDFLVETDPQNIAYLTAFIESGYRLSGAESHEKDIHGNDKIFVNSLVGVVEDGGLVRAWGTQADVTEQRRAVEALRQSEERLQLALKASQTGIWEWDIAANHLTWSEQLKKIYGLTPSTEITYDGYQDLLYPEDKPAMQQVIQRAMKDGSSYSIEHRVIWPDKSVHWVLGQGQAFLEKGKAVRMIGTSRLIDERKRAEIRLQESEQRFRNLADTAPVLIWLSDTENLGTYFNRPWLEFTGRTLKQELGGGWTEAVHPDDLPRAAAYCDAHFRAQKEFRMEFRLRRKDGEYRWVLDHGIPRYDDKGTFLGYIGSCIDIQEAKTSRQRTRELEEINQKLQQQRAELVALNQSKDEFISLASHQLRTPATGVKQYIGMLLEGYGGKLSPEQIKMLRTAYESNERQLKIIDDLLKVAHIDAGKVTLQKSPTDLITLITDIIDEQSDRFKRKKQTVTFKHTDKKLMLSIDQGRMRMVLENLIDNASKYSGEGKHITVSARKTPKYVKIAVQDQGVGIAKKDISRLFQKFSRINNSLSTLVGGTGLGLYWAEKIVSLHAGTITIESELRKGSTFTITIPRKSS